MPGLVRFEESGITRLEAVSPDDLSSIDFPSVELELDGVEDIDVRRWVAEGPPVVGHDVGDPILPH